MIFWRSGGFSWELMANLLRDSMIGLSDVTDYPNCPISATVMLRVSGVLSSPVPTMCSVGTGNKLKLFM